jgi:hypothetical protein
MTEWAYTPDDWRPALAGRGAAAAPDADDLDRWLKEYRRWRVEWGYEPTPAQHDHLAGMYLQAGAIGQMFTPWMLE